MQLTIGQLAKKVKVNPKTIRYYEEVGLMPKARRSESGYRLYTEEEVARMQLIRRAKLLGLSLHESKSVVEYATTGRCLTLEGHLLELLETKVARLENQMAELRLLREELQALCGSLKERVGADRSGATGMPCSCLENPDGVEGRPNSAFPGARDS